MQGRSGTWKQGSRVAAGLALGLGLVVVVGLLSGCNDPLFPKDAERTPYERYQAFRGLDRQATTTDAFGREQPDLRARLAPLESR